MDGVETLTHLCKQIVLTAANWSQKLVETPPR